MNLRKSKISDSNRLMLNIECKMDLKKCVKYIAL